MLCAFSFQAAILNGYQWAGLPTIPTSPSVQAASRRGTGGLMLLRARHLTQLPSRLATVSNHVPGTCPLHAHAY